MLGCIGTKSPQRGTIRDTSGGHSCTVESSDTRADVGKEQPELSVIPDFTAVSEGRLFELLPAPLWEHYQLSRYFVGLVDAARRVSLDTLRPVIEMLQEKVKQAASKSFREALSVLIGAVKYGTEEDRYLMHRFQALLDIFEGFSEEERERIIGVMQECEEACNTLVHQSR